MLFRFFGKWYRLYYSIYYIYENSAQCLKYLNFDDSISSAHLEQTRGGVIYANTYDYDTRQFP